MNYSGAISEPQKEPLNLFSISLDLSDDNLDTSLCLYSPLKWPKGLLSLDSGHLTRGKSRRKTSSALATSKTLFLATSSVKISWIQNKQGEVMNFLMSLTCLRPALHERISSHFLSIARKFHERQVSMILRCWPPMHNMIAHCYRNQDEHYPCCSLTLKNVSKKRLAFILQERSHGHLPAHLYI